MALTKDKKKEVISQISQLLDESKMTVIAGYQGTPVKALQRLRRDGKTEGTTVKVVKNRLVIQALKASDKFKDIDSSNFNGMLLYAFNPTDEAAPAKTLADFAKTQPTIEFIGAINDEGKLISGEDVKALASLPSKDELIASVLSTLSSPVDGVMNGLSGNLHGLLDGLAAKAAN